MNIAKIYFHPDFADCYTVYVDIEEQLKPGFFECLTLSRYPEHPQGVSMWGSGQLGPHNGQEMKLEELPEHIQKHITRRIQG